MNIFVPMGMPNIRIHKVTAAFRGHPNHENEKELIAFAKMLSSSQQLVIGDFTITGPFSPFENFPVLGSYLMQKDSRVKVVTEVDAEKLK